MKTTLKFISLICIAALMLAACAEATPMVIRETSVVEVTSVVRETQVVEVEVTGEAAAPTVVRLSGWVSSPAETALWSPCSIASR
jgi:multiple sugar transport system substrate-binding protein